ncbi:MAG: SpoIIE family protein phosphatase [Anaerolineales bacterium]|nr:SpoIIE family protein phosphatase [Anaerolineales bacterium]
MATVNAEMLRKLPFLEGARPEVVERLAGAVVERSFQTGQVILQEGSTGRELYLIVEGLVEVVRGREAEEVVLAKRGPGDFFGEMGIIEDSPRFATIRALEPTHLLEFSERDLRSVLVLQPLLLYQAVRVLSARLREADLQMIADLQRKNQELAQAYRELQEAQAALVEKERLERELELARELQQSILPQEFPDLPGFNCAARSRPARQVGGDFYDVIPLSGGRVGLVMADVSDKGLAAALYMALTRSLIHAEAKHSSSPRKVLLKIHRLLLEMGQADMFVTVFYGVLDPAEGTLRYARAGHDRPLLFSPITGECRFLAADGILLGYVEKVRLEEVDVHLRPGDLLVLYTDGITDANSPAGEFFGVERLREAVSAAGGLSAQDVCDLIFEHVDRFQAEAVQHDDMALLVVKATMEDLWPD